MEEKLKPCPFNGCNNKNIEVLSEQISFSKYKYFTYCSECGAKGPREDTEAEAIAAWNKRS